MFDKQRRPTVDMLSYMALGYIHHARHFYRWIRNIHGDPYKLKECQPVLIMYHFFITTSYKEWYLMTQNILRNFCSSRNYAAFVGSLYSNSIFCDPKKTHQSSWVIGIGEGLLVFWTMVFRDHILIEITRQNLHHKQEQIVKKINKQEL